MKKYEYTFQEMSVQIGLVTNKYTEHIRLIRRYAEDGWRYVGWIPVEQVTHDYTKIQLVFEREV